MTAKKEVILTAGAIGSSKLLLDSGIGDKTELEAVGVKSVVDIKDVGKGLTDHYTASISWNANGTDQVYGHFHYNSVGPSLTLVSSLSTVSTPQKRWTSGGRIGLDHTLSPLDPGTRFCGRGSPRTLSC